jgi:hypothetical protein
MTMQVPGIQSSWPVTLILFLGFRSGLLPIFWELPRNHSAGLGKNLANPDPACFSTLYFPGNRMVWTCIDSN